MTYHQDWSKNAMELVCETISVGGHKNTYSLTRRLESARIQAKVDLEQIPADLRPMKSARAST